MPFPKLGFQNIQKTPNSSGAYSHANHGFINLYILLLMDKLTKTQVKNEAIRFMYFANNYSAEQLEGCFNCTSSPQHLKDKYYAKLNTNLVISGTDTFLWWFMQLSRDNQEGVVDYINANYKGIS